jgi:NADPH:quinone reductase-like Zn-dependent oxidoreductase
MMAAVLHEVGGIPRYEEFPDPVAGEDEVIVDVKAVAVENVDKMVAAGTHYASSRYISQLPAIPGFDGVGTLPDGTLVGFGNPRPPYGALASKTVVASNAVAPIPAGLDAATAVVLATAITGMSIRTAAGFVAGETVLVQGATGVAGRLAVKVARLLGAGRIVGTGRDEEALGEVQALGADTVINTAVPDEALAQAFADARGDGYDVVLDFLWGRPTEILLRTLIPASSSTIATAAAPSGAVPTTSIPSQSPTSMARPSRTARWSSATTTRTGTASVMPARSRRPTIPVPTARR